MKQIISASRRTDIPRWYLQQTIDALKKGEITLPNPLYKEKMYTISLKPEDIEAIVWWSKDYSIWIQNRMKDPKFFSKYNHFFQFTLNGYSDPHIQKLLEYGVTSSFDNRLSQIRILAKLYSPLAINWRFDPIVYWKEDNKICNNMGDFETILKVASESGIKRCTISFCDWTYKKSELRAKSRNLIFIIPSNEIMKRDSIILGKKATEYGVTLYSCANNVIVDNKWVHPSHCVDSDLIARLYGDDISRAKDPSQRLTCGCAKSRDIGNYAWKCKHGCTYCYAEGI